MSYDKLDKFITDLGKPDGIPFGAASMGFLALKKLAQVEHEPPRPVAPAADAVREVVAGITACELQKEASGFPNQSRYFTAFLTHLGGECAPQEKIAGLSRRVALEEQSMVLKEKLSNLLGPGHPVFPTIRSFIQTDREVLADLRTAPAQEKTAGRRLAERVVATRNTKLSAVDVIRGYIRDRKKVAQPVVVPPPNSDTPENYVAREKQLAHDQALQELAHTKMQLNQTAMVAQQAQQEGVRAQEALAQAEQAIQMSQEETQAAHQESQAHQQQAVEAEGRAAQHATQKMQLGMRVQQMRQALAEIATQDPVTETAAGANDMALQGAPATPDQMAQADAEQTAAEEQAAAGPPNAEQQKEVQQAENAQVEAAEQSAEAEQAMGATAPAAPATTPAAPPPGGMAAA